MEGFKEGYSFFEQMVGTNAGTIRGQRYVSNIEKEIDKLFYDDKVGLNSFKGIKTNSAQLKGDIAEFWHAGTYNIDAALHDSPNRADVPRSHDMGSPDIIIHTKEGDTAYSSKVYQDAKSTVKAQSVTYRQRYMKYLKKHPETSFEEFLNIEHVPVDKRGTLDQIGDKSIYNGQKRLVPKGQQKDARIIADKMSNKEKGNQANLGRQKQVDRYRGRYVDTVRDKDGNHSFSENKETFQKIADDSKQGKADPKDFHLTSKELIQFKYILNQAAKAGMSAATIQIVLKTGPEIFKSIEYLIRTGKIDGNELKKIGAAAITGAADGFLRGSIAAEISIFCNAGYFGEAAKNISPIDLGALTTITINTVKNAIDLALGKISNDQFANKLVQDVVISTCSIIMGKAVGAIFSSFWFFGYMLGSFVGSVIGGFILSKGCRILMSICVETGFTCFGLVHQDYEFPDYVLADLGLDIVALDELVLDEFQDNDEILLDPIELDQIELDSLKIWPFRRGIIGVSTIGYVS